MSTLAGILAALAIAVALVYVVIAVYVVPRIDLAKADRRIVLLVRGGAGAFFVGCAATHVHMAVHYLSDPATANVHQLVFHIPQVIGGWLFVLVSGRHLDVAVVRRKSAQERQTERKLAVEREERARAVEGSRLKSEFLANMSHEIRTPMNGVIGIAEALADTPLDQQQLEYVRMIRSSGDSLLAVINDILDVSKIEAGKLQLEQVEFNIGDLVEEVCVLLANSAAAKGLAFDLALDPALDRNVVGDCLRIRQILTNMVGNAVKFTADGRVQVTVQQHDRHVRFEVRDSGPGVDPARQHALFDEFSQADSSTSRTFGGSGLGLAICKRLAEAMGGEVGMTSELGKGSTFWFTVQLRDELPKPRQALSSLSGRRALAVLGAERGPATLDCQLESWGMAVATVRPQDLEAELRSPSGAAAEVVLVEEGPQCPQPLRLLETVRRQFPVLPIVAVGARQIDAPLMQDERSAQLVKPVRRSAIYNTVAALLAVGAEEIVVDGDDDARNAALRATGRGRRLLLAEDDRINQVVALAMLHKRGYTVEVANNGREAVQMLASGDFQAVLMDCQMPELDGYQATAAIRRGESAGRHTPIIAMTAHSMLTDRETCLAAGMDDYVSKPVRSADLDAVLLRWLPANEPAGEERSRVDGRDVGR